MIMRQGRKRGSLPLDEKHPARSHKFMSYREKKTFSSKRKHFTLKPNVKWLIMIINDCSNKPFPDAH